MHFKNNKKIYIACPAPKINKIDKILAAWSKTNVA